MPSIMTAEEYLFEMDVDDDDIMSDVDELDTCWEPYMTYDEDMEAFEDEQFNRAYGFDEYEDEFVDDMYE